MKKRNFFILFFAIGLFLNATVAYAEEPVQQTQDANCGLYNIQEFASRVSYAIRELDRVISRIVLNGYSVSQEIIDSLASARNAISIVQSAAEVTGEVMIAQENLEDFFDIFHENIEVLHVLSRLKRAFNKAEKEMARMHKRLDRAKQRVDATPNIGSLVTTAETNINLLDSALNEAKQYAQTDALMAQEIMREDFYSQMEDGYKSIERLYEFLKLTKSLEWIEDGIKEAEMLTRELKSKQADVAEEENMIAQMRDLFSALKNVLASNPVDMRSAFEISRDLDFLKNDFFRTISDKVGDNKPHGPYFGPGPGFDFGPGPGSGFGPGPDFGPAGPGPGFGPGHGPGFSSGPGPGFWF